MALDVYLTNACNLRCRFCFNLDREDAPRIPLDDIREILRAAYEQGNRYVSITGGEPFIYKQIFEVLDFAHDLGYWITILSHGGLLDESRIQRLKKYWRLRVRISLDGPDRATHDALRGAGTFDVTMEKISMLLNRDINVGIGITVSENNVSSLHEMLGLCMEKGVAFVRCSPVARVKNGKAAHVTSSLHETMLKTLLEFTIQHMDRIDLPGCDEETLPASLNVLSTRRCMAGKHFFGITPDSKILPCPLIADHPDIPTIYFQGGQSFMQLGQQMDKLFGDMKERLDGICRTCEFREVCFGGCLAEKLSFERNLADEQPVCTKLILEKISSDFNRANVDRIVRSWVWRLQNSLEPTNGHACMRQAPYWSVNFKAQDRWNESTLRYA